MTLKPRAIQGYYNIMFKPKTDKKIQKNAQIYRSRWKASIEYGF